MRIDARIPVVFGLLSDLQPTDALLTDAPDAPAGVPTARLGPETPGHPPNCLCCVPRGEAGEALGRLFQARARAEVAFFRRVLAVVDDQAAIRQAVLNDRLAAAWFRLG